MLANTWQTNVPNSMTWDAGFLAGRESMKLEMVELARNADLAIEAAIKEGMQKVMDWFMTHGYSGGPIQYSDGIKARFDPSWDEWQKFKQENGLQPEGSA